MCRLADAWDEIDADDGVRCAILTGAAGDFCAGADLDKLVARSIAGLPPEDEFEERIRKDYTIIFNGLLRNRQLKKPLIAAVEGYCVAGGTEILQGTDIRVAGEGSMFGVTEAKWSLYPQGGSVIRLRRQIPYTKAMEMLLTADMYPAEEALAFGLIGRVVPKGQALAVARNSRRRSPPTGRSPSRRSRKPSSRPNACPRRTRSTSTSGSASRSTRRRTPARARRRSRRSGRRSSRGSE